MYKVFKVLIYWTKRFIFRKEICWKIKQKHDFTILFETKLQIVEIKLKVNCKK